MMNISTALGVPKQLPLATFPHHLHKTSIPKSSFPPPFENAPFENMPPVKENIKKLTPTLLAPQYSHLLEEAKAFDDMDSSPAMQELDEPSAQVADISNESLTNDELVDRINADKNSKLLEESIPFQNESFSQKESARTLSNRVRGFFSSYLPVLSQRQCLQQETYQKGTPGLPLPPPSILQKERGPVATPVRPQCPRAPHPKELVHLNPAPPPSQIPQLKKVPKRLVELIPIPPAVTTDKTALKIGLVPRPRRSSGSSVKDLVKGFEEMDEMVKRNATPFITHKVGNVCNTRREQGQAQSLKPKWRV